MSEKSPIYRGEARFKEILELTRPDFLLIQQIEGNAFIIATAHPKPASLYVMATVRSPDEPRTFVDVGRAIHFARALSGLNSFHVELLHDLS